MRRKRYLIPALALGVALTMLPSAGGADAPRELAAKPIRLADATIIVEVNATDGDAGLQVFLDGKAWRRVTITSPDGRRMLAVGTRGRLRDWGLTELFSESSEPPFDDVPLFKFKKRFPEGRYRFRGRTVNGRLLVGSAMLTHDIPKGPVITSPAEDASVPLGDVLVSWEAVTKPAGIVIVGYRVIVSDETSPRGFTAELEVSRSATSVTIPSEFFKSGNEYKVEIQSIERSGNQTSTEQSFTVA